MLGWGGGCGCGPNLLYSPRFLFGPIFPPCTAKNRQQRVESLQGLAQSIPVPPCCMQMLLQMSNLSSVWIFKGQEYY